MDDALTGLPGADRIARGVEDARRGDWTVDALLVALAPTRLAALGVRLLDELPDDPELRLYRALEDSDDPYARYNALRRELDSFLAALESRRRRERAATLGEA